MHTQYKNSHFEQQQQQSHGKDNFQTHLTVYELYSITYHSIIHLRQKRVTEHTIKS